MHSINIRTPEGVIFSLNLAGPVVRMLALLVDMAAIITVTSVIRSVLGLAFIINPDFGTALFLILYFAVTVGYGIFFEWLWNGQTLGKRLLRLRVADENGHRLLFSQIAVRNLLRFVDSLPVFYLVGGIATLLNRRAQRLGDLAAGTVVVRQPRVGMPDVEQIGETKYNSFSDYPFLEARLRSLVSPKEASLALSALLRRNELDDNSRLTVFQELAGRFKQIVIFPPEITDDISDEQFVRNAVCSLYRLNTQQS
ncbi:RDD family protein [Tichowtungia aerotolerans]|uniref:RDD family protein n=1 Tax=Tichowtungia aerotolerans TaxID=2697043 RepID=A0A6P1M8F2_9BACT|nr:RDD family protein [Tichowtungia aerotolerans]QHI68408.1 RDD family protein [Tichowtungia aerotolerans]